MRPRCKDENWKLERIHGKLVITFSYFLHARQSPTHQSVLIMLLLIVQPSSSLNVIWYRSTKQFTYVLPYFPPVFPCFNLFYPVYLFIYFNFILILGYKYWETVTSFLWHISRTKPDLSQIWYINWYHKKNPDMVEGLAPGLKLVKFGPLWFKSNWITLRCKYCGNLWQINEQSLISRC